MDLNERILNLRQFVEQEHRLIDEFENFWDQFLENGNDRLSVEAWAERYHEFLAAVDSGEIKCDPWSGDEKV